MAGSTDDTLNSLSISYVIRLSSSEMVRVHNSVILRGCEKIDPADILSGAKDLVPGC